MHYRLHRACCTLYAVVLILGLWIVPASAAVDPSVSGRTDFLWGVGAHNRTYGVYPEKNLEDHIRLAAELGVKLFRWGHVPGTADDLAYIDKVVALTQAYGMEVLYCVAYDRSATADIFESRTKMIAKRYNGKNGYGHIRYFQVFNEMDNTCGTGAGDGSHVSHYDMVKFQPLVPLFKAAIKGIKSGNPEAQTVINISYKHTGIFDLLLQHGVQWDINGLDWYSNMGDIVPILNKLLNDYDKDVMICETNFCPEKDNGYDSNVTYLPELMKQVYRYNTRIKGMIFYELLDELNYETEGAFNREAHFGLVHCDKEGNIGTPKPVYTAIQRLLGGGKVTPTYPKTTAATKRTTTAARKPDPTTKPAVTTMGTTKKAEPTRPQGGGKATTTRAATPKPGTPSTTAAPSGETIDPAAATTTAIDTPVGPAGTVADTTGAAARTTSPGTGGGFNILFVIIPVAVVLLAGAGVAAYLLYRRKSNDRPPLP